MALRAMAPKVQNQFIADIIVIAMNVVSLVLLLLCIIMLLSVLWCSDKPVAWDLHAAPNFLGHAPAQRSLQVIHHLELGLYPHAEPRVRLHGLLEHVHCRVRLPWQSAVAQHILPFDLDDVHVRDGSHHVLVEEGLHLRQASVDGGLEDHGPCTGTVLILLLVHVLALVQVLVLVHVLVLV